MEQLFVLASGVFLIFIASLLFTDVIEYQCARLRLSGPVTGHIITPIFTSLPELSVFLVSLFLFHSAAGRYVALGTVIGEPLVITTVAYFLLAIAFLVLERGRQAGGITVNDTMRIPYLFVALLFPLILLPGYLQLPQLQYVLGWVYLLLYLLYFLLVYRSAPPSAGEVTDIPYLVRLFGMPAVSIIQLLLSVVGLYAGSVLSVDGILLISGLQVERSLSYSAVLIPLATTMPETIIAVSWLTKGRYELALGSLVGENVLYVTFYPALSMFFLHISLYPALVASVAVTSFMSLLYYIHVRKGSLSPLLPPLGFALFLFFILFFVL